MKSFFLKLGFALAIQTVLIIILVYFNMDDNRIINGLCTLFSMLGSLFIYEKYFKKN